MLQVQRVSDSLVRRVAADVVSVVAAASGAVCGSGRRSGAGGVCCDADWVDVSDHGAVEAHAVAVRLSYELQQLGRRGDAGLEKRKSFEKGPFNII